MHKWFSYFKLTPLQTIHFLMLIIFVLSLRHYTLPLFYLTMIMYYFYLILPYGIGLHRYAAHRSFKACSILHWLLLLITVPLCLGTTISWGTVHRMHHAASDTEGDPHSPRFFGFWHLVLGVWYNNIKLNKRFLAKSHRDPAELFIHRYYFSLLFIFGLLMLAGGTHFFIYGYVVPIFALRLIVSINLTLHHRWGYANFNTNDYSKNNWALFPLSLGEAWHNNHHHHADNPYQRHRWWELDPQGLIIKYLFNSNGHG